MFDRSGFTIKAKAPWMFSSRGLSSAMRSDKSHGSPTASFGYVLSAFPLPSACTRNSLRQRLDNRNDDVVVRPHCLHQRDTEPLGFFHGSLKSLHILSEVQKYPQDGSERCKPGNYPCQRTFDTFQNSQRKIDALVQREHSYKDKQN